MPFGVCACAWGQFRRTMAAPFGVPGCSTLIPFRVQFFGVRGLPPIFAPQPTTPVTFIFLLSRFALLHICIHIYICVKMYVCTYTTKCKCVHTYLYLHICVYFCIYIYRCKQIRSRNICMYIWAVVKIGVPFWVP